MTISPIPVPIEMQAYIFSFIEPEKLSREPEKLSRGSVKACGRNVLSIALVGSQLFEIYKEKLSELKKIYEFLNKYNAYQDEYEDCWGWRSRFNARGNPQLYDALLTGCKLPLAKSSFENFNEEIESDIKEIVRLTPQSLHCIIGTLRCRYEVTPLAAACHNGNIPIHIVEFLLKNGANPNDTIRLNAYPISILIDLLENISEKRFSEIEELFFKYGYVAT